MAIIVFDGKTNVTATSKDQVLITASPATFTQASDNGSGGSTFTFGGATLTYTDLTVDAADTSTTINGVAGSFSTTDTTAAPTGPNSLTINHAAPTVLTAGTAAGTGVAAFFGGFGIASPADTAETVTIAPLATKNGSYLVYGNGGGDSVTAGGALDSTGFATVFGGGGNDTIDLQAANLKANLFLVGGRGVDSIEVVNTTDVRGGAGSTIILGGEGPGDSADAGDTIGFGGGGVFTIYGNGGDDSIDLGAGTNLDSTSVGVVYGGVGNDTVNVQFDAASKGGTITIFGGENVAGGAGVDSITVAGNAGRTVIYGGTGPGDAADGADSISFTAQVTGTTKSSATIYANGGNDTVNLVGAAGGDVTVFAGGGNDLIQLTGQQQASGATLLSGNEGTDTFRFGTADGATLGGAGFATVQDFTLGTDKLVVADNGGTNQGAINRGVSTAGSVNDALNAAAADPNRVGVITFGADTYVVVNDGAAGYQAATDLAIKLTGVTDTLAVTNAVTVV